MLCIAAFIIFLILFPILGFFPEYRKLFRQSWECVFKKVTLKPCDINLGEELKNKFLGKLIFKYPKVVGFLDKTFVFWAWLFVILNVWSLGYVVIAGLNLYVYDTCNPVSGESCSLSGEACGIASAKLTFTEAVKTDQLGTWISQPFTDFADTVSRIPDRSKNWKAEDYLPQKPTYYQTFDSSKPTAVEFIDPGCQFCKKLFENIKQAGFQDKYNLTYVVYPINDPVSGKAKFQASQQLANYLEALKDFPLENSQTPADWQLLEMLFTQEDEEFETSLQNSFNLIYAEDEIDSKIKELLSEIGYTDPEIIEIANLASSPEIKERLEYNRNLTENVVKTVRIPTIIFNGRRYDRVVDVKDLK